MHRLLVLRHMSDHTACIQIPSRFSHTLLLLMMLVMWHVPRIPVKSLLNESWNVIHRFRYLNIRKSYLKIIINGMLCYKMFEPQIQENNANAAAIAKTKLFGIISKNCPLILFYQYCFTMKQISCFYSVLVALFLINLQQFIDPFTSFFMYWQTFLFFVSASETECHFEIKYQVGWTYQMNGKSIF